MISAKDIPTSELSLGESVAVNGVCLTVTHLNSDTFSVLAGGETLRRTTLGDLRASSKVNLERAMQVGGRLGGHMVSGHVDGIGTIASKANKDSTPFADILKSEGVRSDAFWTYASGKGRVFGTTTGHYTYTYFDPMYRLILLRGIAWSLREDPAPFMPLVFHDITNEEGLVGTTDTMMNYRNRKE